ncbi:hypothetical protein ACPWSR_18000 [Alloiococcus sp. CFN-8]|uniref:hypothetical protein n=1 Tax=Alloiococcus sp. CFN-8 TaxID=3416081 RepID=UPI003CEB0277
MDGTSVIDLRELIFKGEILEIGRDDNYIIYNFLKEQGEEVSVDIVENEEDFKEECKGKYDNIVLFFFLSSLNSKKERLGLIKEIKDYIKPSGELYIFDIEKKSLKPYKNKIKILFSEENYKELLIMETNPFLISDLNSVKELIKEDFHIKEAKSLEGVFILQGERK